MNYNNQIIALLAGFAVDLLLGDPYWLPHPIRAFGKLIAFAERKWNSGKNKKLKGTLVSLCLILTTWFFFTAISRLALLNGYVWTVVAAIVIFYGLANRSLITEAFNVEKELMQNGMNAGRKQLSYIVGRETKNLDENQIRTAILETLAENLSDGVIAPLFYFAIGSFPLMMAYKMINTLDSMIGYKNERYQQFGWFSAHFDDLVNFIPARLTATLMILITFSLRGLQFIFLYGRKHSSPNAGYPEATLAGILNCRFGGPNIYHGKKIDKPYIGNNQREITTKDIEKTTRINLAVSFVAIAGISIFFYQCY